MKYLLLNEKNGCYEEVSIEELERYREENEVEMGYQFDVVKFERYEDGKMYFGLACFEI